MRLMQGFTIDPKIHIARAREMYFGILMIMNQGGTTTMTDKDTSALIETLKATNEELLKQVTLQYLTKKLYEKSSEKNVVNTNQLSLFDEDKAGG